MIIFGLRHTFILTSILALLLSGCFEGGSSSKSSDSTATGLISAANFGGAKTASNSITGIKLAWEPSSVTPISYRVYRVAGTKLTLLAALSADTTGFIDGSVTWGIIYSYIVRAVDTNGVEDANLNKVSSLAWGGISTVSSSSRTTIQVDFVSTSAVVDEIRVYAQPAAGGDKILAGTGTGSDSTITLTGLKTGFAYVISAQAFVSSLKKEDGNNATFAISTNTLGYHDDESSTAKWMNVTNVRAFGLSPGAGLHPLYPERTPRTNVVDLSFRAFNGMPASTNYAVTRAPVNSALDTSVTTICTPASATSCRVRCSSSATLLTGSGVIHCRDENVAPSPAKYRYTMSIVSTEGSVSWTEPVPQDDQDSFSVLVAIPPNNMVLAQRDAVNFEMCGQLNAAPDAKNHNRCPYAGIAAVPFNSGPGKPPLSFDSGYYDFGYNLFVDRFEQGCHWTRAVDGGMCGPGGTPGDCIAFNGQLPMDNSIGKNGDVFQRLGHNNDLACYYKSDDTWVRAAVINSTVADPASVYKKMFTSDPSANGGKVGTARELLSQITSSAICQSQSDTIYGAKRLPRVREYRAFAAMPTTAGDLYGMTYATSWVYVQSGAFNPTNGFRCPRASSFTATTTDFTLPTNLTELLGAGNTTVLGVYTGGLSYGNTPLLSSSLTSDCQGRYGLKDALGLDANVMTSDNLALNGPALTMTGMVSIFDNGNRDLLQDVNGGQTGFFLNFSTAAVSGTSYRYFNKASSSTTATVPYVALTLGLPILATSSTVYTPRPSFVESYGAADAFIYTSTSTNFPMAFKVYDRWMSTFTSGYNGSASTINRCVMSAD